MRELAKAFPGAILVFSTLRKSLSKAEIAQMTRLAKTGRKYWKADRPINPVLILTGTELLDFGGPPYCWSEPHKQKFQRIHGLLKICDATQQIYLNLPSWQTEWQQAWEKKRKKRAAIPQSLPAAVQSLGGVSHERPLNGEPPTDKS